MHHFHIIKTACQTIFLSCCALVKVECLSHTLMRYHQSRNWHYIMQSSRLALFLFTCYAILHCNQTKEHGARFPQRRTLRPIHGKWIRWIFETSRWWEFSSSFQTLSSPLGQKPTTFYPEIIKNSMFEKCEFCHIWYFKIVNFVKNEILKL